jgi:phosphatidylglycerophosphatase A
MAHRRSISSFADLFSTAFGIGFLPVAPGTFGSLPGLPLAWGCHMLLAWLWEREIAAPLWGAPALISAGVLILLASWAAVWCIGHTEKAWRCHDDKSIVIDEVVGQMAVAIFLPLSIEMYCAAFALFRLFDIWKPGPAGWVDRNLGGPLATLLDDLIAALFTLILLGAYLLLRSPA